MGESSKLPKKELYPKFLQSTDGTEQIKIISRRSYIYTCFYRDGDLYTARVEHKANSEYTETSMLNCYKLSEEEYFLEKLGELARYFANIKMKIDHLTNTPA
ncbi:hypothetical protein EFA69_16050 [Rufibacter immobilis]|uniref:Uncharacterized protein n=1 Tax=Rufibacter immobilis TaxID=1348778 RepID=A0A3M9MQ35_9BACT|nr:hypothetical protein [Rufibacter immobilis]RNI27629.1 hypothetical protein EFA69_16050 [Rufibacter immobilis]